MNSLTRKLLYILINEGSKNQDVSKDYDDYLESEKYIPIQYRCEYRFSYQIKLSKKYFSKFPTYSIGLLILSFIFKYKNRKWYTSKKFMEFYKLQYKNESEEYVK